MSNKGKSCGDMLAVWMSFVSAYGLKLPIIATIGVLLAASLFFAFVHFPLAEETAQMQADIDKSRRIVDGAVKFVRDNAGDGGIKRYAEKVAKRHDVAAAALPDDLSPSDFLRFVSSLAEENNVKLNAFSLGESKPLTNFAAELMSVNLTITGDYFSLLDFLGALSQSLRPVAVTNYTLEAMQTGKGRDLTMFVTVVTPLTSVAKNSRSNFQ